MTGVIDSILWRPYTIVEWAEEEFTVLEVNRLDGSYRTRKLKRGGSDA